MTQNMMIKVLVLDICLSQDAIGIAHTLPYFMGR